MTSFFRHIGKSKEQFHFKITVRSADRLSSLSSSDLADKSKRVEKRAVTRGVFTNGQALSCNCRRGAKNYQTRVALFEDGSVKWDEALSIQATLYRLDEKGKGFDKKGYVFALKSDGGVDCGLCVKVNLAEFVRDDGKASESTRVFPLSADGDDGVKSATSTACEGPLLKLSIKSVRSDTKKAASTRTLLNANTGSTDRRTSVDDIGIGRKSREASEDGEEGKQKNDLNQRSVDKEKPPTKAVAPTDTRPAAVNSNAKVTAKVEDEDDEEEEVVDGVKKSKAVMKSFAIDIQSPAASTRPSMEDDGKQAKAAVDAFESWKKKSPPTTTSTVTLAPPVSSSASSPTSTFTGSTSTQPTAANTPPSSQPKPHSQPKVLQEGEGEREREEGERLSLKMVPSPSSSMQQERIHVVRVDTVDNHSGKGSRAKRHRGSDSFLASFQEDVQQQSREVRTVSDAFAAAVATPALPSHAIITPQKSPLVRPVNRPGSNADVFRPSWKSHGDSDDRFSPPKGRLHDSVDLDNDELDVAGGDTDGRSDSVDGVDEKYHKSNSRGGLSGSGQYPSGRGREDSLSENTNQLLVNKVAGVQFSISARSRQAKRGFSRFQPNTSNNPNQKGLLTPEQAQALETGSMLDTLHNELNSNHREQFRKGMLRNQQQQQIQQR